MSKRKGLSLDDKRIKLLDAFQDTPEVYVLKEVEKMAVKKGITLQSVKDVLQSLVDDDLVRQEKIGSSNYFWSFPAEASVKMANDAARTAAELAGAKKRKTELQAAVAQEKSGKAAFAGYAEAMAGLQQLRARHAGIKQQLEAYKENDPEAVEAMRKGAELAKAAANRWLDNIYCLQSWTRQEFQGHEEAIRNLFTEHGYKDQMDYIE